MISYDFPFDPFFLFKSPLGQTLMGWLLNIPTKPKSETKIIELSDNDKLAMEITTPKGWNKKDLTVVMVHGLCGSHNSISLIRMARKLEKEKIRSVRLNLRGCGSGKGLAKSTYHSGRIDDVIEALKVLKEENPDSPKILIGFSMGGNIVLKLAGELKERTKEYISKVIALSPPIDMFSSVKLFEKDENWVYLRYFSNLLKEDVEYLKKTFSDFPNIVLPKHMTLDDFNRYFVVPFFGFADVNEYYKYASSKYVIDKITIPCKILISKDDPIVSWESFNELALPENVEVFVTRFGGHLGYVGNPADKRGFYWLDSVLFDWILDR